MLVNGHNLYVEDHGPRNGPVIVLLHHGLGSVKAWRWQVPILVEAGYRIVAYDRWGHGGSDTRQGLDLPTFKTDLADLHTVLDLLDIPLATLVGHSDGGTIALYFAIQQPERVNCLVTVAAHIYVEPKMERTVLEIRQVFETDARFRKSMQVTHGDNFPAVFNNWFDSWHKIDSTGWDMRSMLGQISCPTLIIQGTEDEHATPQHAKDIARSIQGAELWLLKKAKHMLPQENFAEFNSRTLRFLHEHVQRVNPEGGQVFGFGESNV